LFLIIKQKLIIYNFNFKYKLFDQMEAKHCDTIVSKAVCGFYEFLGTLILTAAIVLIANNGGDLMGIPLALYAGI